MEKEQIDNMLSSMLVGVISLGCDKNRVDTENMMTHLSRHGMTFTADSSQADIIIINTCAFIKSSREETYQTIEEMVEFRKTGRCTCLITTGCFPQSRVKELQNDFPEIDIFLGVNDYANIYEIVKQFYSNDDRRDIISVDTPFNIDCIEEGRLITTPAHYAYIKIADGCDNFCSYCLIPYIRGRFRSRKIESVVKEANDLVKNGAKEILLVAQDVAKFGEDIYGENKLAELLQELSKIEKLEWIRLLYCYPEHLTEGVIQELLTNPKVCGYIDVPFQHVNNAILKAMNRKVEKGDIIRLLEKLKNGNREIAIRSTFILGFPGETKENFNELIKFLNDYKLPNVGFFTYSRESGTVAGRLDGQVDDSIKKRRLLQAVKVQKKVIFEYNKSLVGRTLKVIYEGTTPDGNFYYGRSEFQAPDIDTLTYFTSNKPIEVGNFYNIKIDKVKGYDLFGHVED